MSVRIYQLSKQLGIENKQLIALLQERGLKVDSPSNTIPNIYADALTEEFGKKEPVAPAEAVAAPAPVEKIHTPDAKHFVKSVVEVDAERVAKAQPAAAAPKPAEPAPAVVVAEKAPAATPVSTVAGAAPKLPLRMPQKPVAARPMMAPSVPSKVSDIEPEFTIRADVAEPAAAKPASLLAGAAPIPARPAMAPKLPSSAPVVADAPEGGRVVVCKPPIVVRDFATLLDLKPFRLISELMELGIFASMNQVIEEDVAVRLASRHGIKLEVRHRGESQAPIPNKVVKGAAKPAEKIEKLESRPPVV
ncbi:MAG: hypothetical protein B7X06_03055, partial [Verrucomicrobia bacterium 21-51-4]